jgi:hypothetical protein
MAMSLCAATTPCPDRSPRPSVIRTAACAPCSLSSPQPWFEDFGRAQLTGGRVRVERDPDFSALIDTDGYHVFLTPEGDCGQLFGSDRSPGAFEVRESGEVQHDVSFSYRVLARRRDLDLARLPIVASPEPVLAEHDVGLGWRPHGHR